MPNNMFENFKYNVDHHYNSIHEYFLLTAVAVVVQKMIFRQETSTAKEMIHAPASMYHDWIIHASNGYYLFFKVLIYNAF